MPIRLITVPCLMLLLLVAPLRGADAAKKSTDHGKLDDSAAASEAAIEQVLEAMERAVLSGDAEAYLAHVATGNSVFLQEQRMWAADLKRHVPDVFDLRIIDPAERKANEEASKAADEATKAAAEPSERAPAERRRGEAQPALTESVEYPHEFTSERAIFELQMSWKMTVPLADKEKGEPDRMDRSVSYPVLFERQGDRWLFRGERWIEVRLDPDHAIANDSEDADASRPPSPAVVSPSTRDNLVLCFPGYEDLAKRAAEVLPEVRAHVDDGFERDVPHPQVVKIYPTMRHLQASIYLSYVDGLAGWNEPKEAIKILGRPGSSRASLRTLLAHEYGHVATFELGPKATDIAWWALEGVAELSSEGFRARGRRDVDRRVQQWSADRDLAEFASISDFRNTPKEVMRHVYTQGHHMVGYISERFGRTRRNEWFHAMANGASIDEATRSVLGISGGFGQLDIDWRAELRGVPSDEAP